MPPYRYVSPIIKVKIKKTPAVKVKFSGVTVNLENRTPLYDGAYEATPSQEAQTLLTAGTRLENDIVIHPIPSNYGRIEWNGVTLKVY